MASDSDQYGFPCYCALEATRTQGFSVEFAARRRACDSGLISTE